MIPEESPDISRRQFLAAGGLTVATACLAPSYLIAQTDRLVGGASKEGAAMTQASVLSKAVRTSDNMEPALVHPGQTKAAQQKLDALMAKTGKRPNIVWLVIDDMGYGDPGAFGGGAIVGAATPNMDRLAAEGLEINLHLLAAHVHTDPLRHSVRSFARPHRPDKANPRRRQADQKSVG